MVQRVIFTQTFQYPKFQIWPLVSLSKGNADILDVMNSNRKFDVSLDGTLLSQTMNLNAFVLTPAVWICRVRALKEWKYQLPVAIFDIQDVNIFFG